MWKVTRENALRESAPPDPPTARVEYRGAQSEIAVMYADPSDGERFDRLIAPDVRRQLIESARLQGGREVRFGLSRSVTAELLGRTAEIIQTGIPGGICSIHLGGLKPLGEVLQEAKDLVATLRFGALPVPVRLVSEERIKTVWKR